MNAADSSAVLNLIQKKMAEKDEIIREQMEQIVQLEDELGKARTKAEGLEHELAKLQEMKNDYLQLKSQLQQLLG
ncbi:MAG: hypothetical protein SF028_10370 [Candidatus Sumerlaeia bacterium]|nr:hypothetical protein [Candidatus Sumerlaeia bacterium]